MIAFEWSFRGLLMNNHVGIQKFLTVGRVIAMFTFYSFAGVDFQMNISCLFLLKSFVADMTFILSFIGVFTHVTFQARVGLCRKITHCTRNLPCTVYTVSVTAQISF